MKSEDQVALVLLFQSIEGKPCTSTRMSSLFLGLLTFDLCHWVLHPWAKHEFIEWVVPGRAVIERTLMGPRCPCHVDEHPSVLFFTGDGKAFAQEDFFMDPISKLHAARDSDGRAVVSRSQRRR